MMAASKKEKAEIETVALEASQRVVDSDFDAGLVLVMHNKSMAMTIHVNEKNQAENLVDILLGAQQAIADMIQRIGLKPEPASRLKDTTVKGLHVSGSDKGGLN